MCSWLQSLMPKRRGKQFSEDLWNTYCLLRNGRFPLVLQTDAEETSLNISPQSLCADPSEDKRVSSDRCCVHLSNGKLLDLNNPDLEMITIDEIANSLSKICRFGGRLPEGFFYSVAEHSVLVYQIATQLEGSGTLLTPNAKRAIFLHDAAEAFVGDIVRPVKNRILGFGPLESRLADAIFEKFGITKNDTPRSLLQSCADNAMLELETAFFYGVHHSLPQPLENKIEIMCLEPDKARKLFLNTARELGVK